MSLADTMSTAQIREYAGLIHHGGINLLKIINQIMDLTKISAGRYDLRRSGVDAGGVLWLAREAFQSRAAQRGITIDADSCPIGLMVDADESVLTSMVHCLYIPCSVPVYPGAPRTYVRILSGWLPGRCQTRTAFGFNGGQVRSRSGAGRSGSIALRFVGGQVDGGQVRSRSGSWAWRPGAPNPTGGGSAGRLGRGRARARSASGARPPRVARRVPSGRAARRRRARGSRPSAPCSRCCRRSSGSRRRRRGRAELRRQRGELGALVLDRSRAGPSLLDQRRHDACDRLVGEVPLARELDHRQPGALRDRPHRLEPLATGLDPARRAEAAVILRASSWPGRDRRRTGRRSRPRA